MQAVSAHRHRNVPGVRVTATRMIILTCSCFLIFASVAFAQAKGDKPAPQATLKASPPRQGLQTEPVKIAIEYTVRSDLGAGKLTVTYHNVDTGQEFTKTLDAPLSPGKHNAEAVWNPEETLPTGMYVFKVVLSDAQGTALATHETNPGDVQYLTIIGGLTHMLNPDQVMEDLKDLPLWREELDELIATADAAGVDTTRQKILPVVIKDMEFWSREKIEFKQYNIMDRNHRYLKQAVEQAKAELAALSEDPNAFPKTPDIPRPKERFKLRGHFFYHEDQPIYLNGPAMFGFTYRYLPIVRELGFNVIQASAGPRDLWPKSEEPDPKTTSKTGGMKEVLDQCAELGLKVDLGLTPHFMPEWVYEKWPDSRNQFVLYGMMPYDIEHPEVLKVIEKFFNQVMKEIAGHPALNSIWIANEPEYMNPNERNMAIFRPWLKDKYQSIENLNKAWGTELKSFDDIVASGRKGHPVPDAVSTDAAKLDWWRYSTKRLMRHYNWERDLIRKYEPDLPITVKLYNGTFNPQFKPMSRADEETSFDQMEYMGISGGSYPFSKPYKDFLRSNEPDKLLSNLEYKFGGIRTKLDFWQETMQGATTNNWWAWHPKAAFSPIPSDARTMHQAALAKLDIQRLLLEIDAFNRAPRAPMVFLYPDPLFSRYGEYFRFNDPTNRAVTLLGFNCDYASEKRVAQGRLDNYDVLIMPAANFIRDETHDKVKAFIEEGKTAIVLGAIPDQNERSRPRDASFFQPRGQVEEISFGEYKAIKFKAGKGTIYHLPTVPRSADGKNHLTKESETLIRHFMDKVLTEVLPPQPVVIRNESDDGFIENRTITYLNPQGKLVYLTYVVNSWLDSEQVLTPKYNFNVATSRDLITGKPLDPHRVVVPPADVLLIEHTIAP